MPTANIFDDIPAHLPAERFDSIIHNPSLRLERIVSKGHCTPPGEWYDQKWDEWVLLLSGSARLTIAGEKDSRPLKPGDHLFLPAGQRHRIDWTDPDADTVWLALHLQSDVPER